MYQVDLCYTDIIIIIIINNISMQGHFESWENRHNSAISRLKLSFPYNLNFKTQQVMKPFTVSVSEITNLPVNEGGVRNWNKTAHLLLVQISYRDVN